MPVSFRNVYINSAGFYLPGSGVSNHEMDQFIAPINRVSRRIKERVLTENGIKNRYYAIDAEGKTLISHADMAAQAIKICLSKANRHIHDVGLLAVGSSGGDVLIPGFANMVHGALGAPPMETLSSQGVCCAGVMALKYAAQAIELGEHQHAIVAAAEMPSRLFKHTRFSPQGYDVDFDAHFLRWMLSDGAGALLLNQGSSVQKGVRLKLKWIHQKSFSGDYPVCMQLGLTPDREQSFLDFPSSSSAEGAGALALRQDIRLLPHLFDVSIHEYVKLVREGWLKSDEIDHFLCHYSSERFLPIVESLLDKAGLSIPRERWYSNLVTRGNTGAASIFIMLAEFLDTHELVPGEKIFCFIPESGRISAAYMLLEVDSADQSSQIFHFSEPQQSTGVCVSEANLPSPPHAVPHGDMPLDVLLQNLAGIWHDYRSAVWRTPVVRKLVSGQFTIEDYLQWTAQWIPQVREGSKWMRQAVDSLTNQFSTLGALIRTHAGEEQDDFMILYQDYLVAGGQSSLNDLKRNVGGETLNTYLHALAKRENPVGLLGAIYFIEGTGQRIVPALLPFLRQQLSLPVQAFRFLEYHGKNDEVHLQRWLDAVQMVLSIQPNAEKEILEVAKSTAQLYLMQFQFILSEDK